MTNILTILKILFINNMMIIKKRTKKNLIAIISIFFIAFIFCFIRYYQLIYRYIDYITHIEYSTLMILFTKNLLGLSIISGVYYGTSVLFYNKDTSFFLGLAVTKSDILLSYLIYAVSKIMTLFTIVLLPLIISYGIVVDLGLLNLIYLIWYFIGIIIIGNTGVMILNILCTKLLSKIMNIKKSSILSNIVVSISLVYIFFIIDYKFAHIDKSHFTNFSSFKATFMEVNNCIKMWKVMFIHSFALMLSIIFYLKVGAKYLFTIQDYKGKVSDKRFKYRSTAFKDIKFSRQNLCIIYAIKDIRSIIRTPEYIFNCFLINIVLPISCLGYYLYSKYYVGNRIQMDNIFNNYSVCAMIYCSLILIGFTVNKIAVTAISREGSDINMMKYIPISYEIQIFSKILVAIFFFLFGLPIYIYLFHSWFNIPVYFLILSIIPLILGMFFIGIVGVYIDLINPKFKVSQKMLLFKNNINILIHLIVVSIIIGTTSFIQVKLVKTMRGIGVYYTTVYLLANIISYFTVYKKIKILFNRIGI